MTYADPWPRTDAQWLASLKRAGNAHDAVKPWPKLRIPAAGKPFAPAGVEVGAWVAWEEYEPVRSLSGIPTGERREVLFTGQVWAPMRLRGHVYVVDLEQRVHEKYERDLRPAIPTSEQLGLSA